MSRAEDAVQRIYESAAVRDELTDDEAETLLKWAEAELTRLLRLLDPLRRDSPPFDPEPRPRLKEAVWVEPEIVVEVAFTEWTGVGILRHPSYKGQREDVDPREVAREVGNSSNA
jgi:ATP-dependent DNA ligase